MNNFREKANFLWSIADLLRGHYKQADYGKVILPLTVLRRLDFVLEPTKQKVIEAYEANKSKKPEVVEQLLNNVAKLKFHNRSKFDFNKLAAEPKSIAANFKNYLKEFSQGGQEIIEYFGLKEQIKKLDEYDLLYLVIKEFADAGKIFKNVTTLEMGYIFEELIRKFAELSNETAGEHFTPREVIQLMVDILFVDDQENLTKEGIVRTLYDPACGTGGMLSVAEEYILNLNPNAKLEVFGQELNAESYAICKSDLLIKGQNPTNIKFGNSFTQDGLSKEKFDYMLSNPPFGVDWKKAKTFVENEKNNLGWDGRFGAGLPSISDGSFLFLQHMISKMKESKDGGSRIGIVFNGSPLFSGGAGSGPSEIRKWIISNDMLEAIVALPDQLFYNTGISTYIWVVTDRKSKKRQGKVQLINATGAEMEDKGNPFYRKMLRSLGNKRKEIHEDAISFITKIYGSFREGPYCKIFNNEEFGYYRITVERPKLDDQGKPILDKKGNPVPDADLRDFENIPLTQDIEEYFVKEVIPHIPDAWIDSEKTKIGYEINFTKYFYQYKPLRSLEEIRQDILALEKETLGMIEGIIET
ncbi:SAM-dependent DNA methyltransferase [Leptospira koniambonensis]|uniref:site-specific DNA-methyltransferase (adenine-specific) n=1 Tax=Leptospira koniambonensis TaxID=2484950 RepID=A0A4V3JMT3_9LEPT|nr:class I SAM-dependent DNA methyltransferase [Leptospira koniambonensis]TGL28157.1 SAM-dependent DNA methyltransferase [Leptospira koniambonensis]